MGTTAIRGDADSPTVVRNLLFFDEAHFKEALEAADNKPVTVFRDAIQAANVHFDNRYLRRGRRSNTGQRTRSLHRPPNAPRLAPL